ncbi:MAG: hypothetical protein L0Y72_21700, partial [Gemmataceae bacterium]|nr:hypothetical protein [Gemmataceae bacterium]
MKSSTSRGNSRKNSAFPRRRPSLEQLEDLLVAGSILGQSLADAGLGDAVQSAQLNEEPFAAGDPFDPVQLEVVPFERQDSVSVPVRLPFVGQDSVPVPTIQELGVT